MRPNVMVGAVILFGVIVSVVTPHFVKMATDNAIYEAQKQNELASTVETVNDSSESVSLASNVDLAIASPLIEKPVVVSNPEPVKEVVQSSNLQKTEDKSSAVVFDGLTIEELALKLDKSLNSTLAGKGIIYAKYAVEYGVDPYLVTAISLHETACKWNCSSAVKDKNNVGGMALKNGSLMSFDTLEAGIKAFIYNIKTNYFDKGLNTAELMNKKYAASSSWASKVNMYMNDIKNS